MKIFYPVLLCLSLLLFVQSSYAWSRYLAHVVVLEDIATDFGVLRSCLIKPVASHFGMSVAELDSIVYKEMGAGGIDLPEANEKYKSEYSYIYGYVGNCPRGRD